MSTISGMSPAKTLTGEELLEIIQKDIDGKFHNRKLLLSSLFSNGKSAYDIAVENGFVGTEEEWVLSLTGPMGIGVRLIDTLGSIDELPTVGMSEGDGYVVVGHFWVWSGTAWNDFGSIEGPAGASAYEMAVADGFVGTLEEWRKSMRGNDGIGLRILGSFPSVEQLPEFNNESGDAYIIDLMMYVWVGNSWEPVGQVGPEGKNSFEMARMVGQIPMNWTIFQYLEFLKGKSALEEAIASGVLPPSATQEDFLAFLKGEKGDKGDKGDTGLQGAPSYAIRVKGKVTTELELPEGASAGDAYFIGLNLWCFDGAAWIDLGIIKGEKGDQGIQGDQGLKGDIGNSAYEVAVEEGFLGTQTEWLESLKGAVGLDSYETAVSRGFVGLYDAWVESLKGPEGRRGPQGVQGTPGKGLSVSGAVSLVSELPAEPVQFESWIVGENLNIFIDTAWVDVGPFVGPKGPKGDVGPIGPKGSSAYEVAVGDGYSGTVSSWVKSLKGLSAYAVAVENGYVGTVVEWVASLKGEKGDDGIGIHLKGMVIDIGSLPPTGIEGESYFVGTVLYSYISATWVMMADMAGPQGEQGEQGIQGLSAYEVAKLVDPTITSQSEFILSLKGERGEGLVITGFATIAGDLPALGAEGVWMVGTNIYAWVDSAWIDLGPIQGPEGKNAFDVVRDAFPEVVTMGDFVEHIRGEQGIQGIQGSSIIPMGYLESVEALPEDETVIPGHAYLILGHLHVRSQDNVWVDMGLVKGDTGPEGPMGPGLKIMGRLNSTAELPAEGVFGDGYVIGLDFWGWTGTAYENLGSIKGESGERGLQGKQGIQGEKGEKGDKGNMGTRWISLDRNPNALDGEPNDWALNKYTNQYFLKTGILSWAAIGYLGGGNVYDALWDDKAYVRRNGQWVVNPIQDVVDAKRYHRTKGGWVVDPVDEAPEDGKMYQRVAGGWKEMDRYDLKSATSTGELDLAVQQVFNISATVARTISFVNAPGANRTMTVLIVFNGTGGVITWPAGIVWNNGSAPTLGETTTVVSLLWTGTKWIGNDPISA